MHLKEYRSAFLQNHMINSMRTIFLIYRYDVYEAYIAEFKTRTSIFSGENYNSRMKSQISCSQKLGCMCHYRIMYLQNWFAALYGWFLHPYLLQKDSKKPKSTNIFSNWNGSLLDSDFPFSKPSKAELAYGICAKNQNYCWETAIVVNALPYERLEPAYNF